MASMILSLRRIMKPEDTQAHPTWVSPSMDWMDGAVLWVNIWGSDEIYSVYRHDNPSAWPADGRPGWSIHASWTGSPVPASVETSAALAAEVLR